MDKKVFKEAKQKKQRHENKESSEISRNKALASNMNRENAGVRVIQGVKIEDVKIGSGSEARSGIR